MRKTLLFATFLVLAAAASLHAAQPPRGWILYTRKAGEQYRIRVMDADGKNDRELPHQTAKICLYANWSPDGKRIAYMTGDKLDGPRHKVVLCDADGSNLATLKTPGERSGMAVWSPDGKYLAVISGNNANPGIYVGDSEGNDLRLISSAEKGAMFPFWTADSKRVGYTQFAPPDGKSDLVSSKPDGTEVSTLVNSDDIVIAGYGASSPDGKSFLYTLIEPLQQKATLRLRAYADGKESDLVQIPLPMADLTLDAFPFTSWDTDGKSFLVSLPTDKGIGIFRFNADGSGKTRMTPEGSDCFGPALWSASP